MKHRWVVGMAVLACLVVAGGAAARTELATGTKLTKVTLQLKWVTQAQFAGYYAAKAKGFYEAERLDVTLRPGGPDLLPERGVIGGGAQLGVDWLSNLLSARDRGVPVVNIAQVFAYSAAREIAFTSSGIKGPADLRGRK